MKPRSVIIESLIHVQIKSAVALSLIIPESSWDSVNIGWSAGAQLSYEV